MFLQIGRHRPAYCIGVVAAQPTCNWPDGIVFPVGWQTRTATKGLHARLGKAQFGISKKRPPCTGAFCEWIMLPSQGLDDDFNLYIVEHQHAEEDDQARCGSRDEATEENARGRAGSYTADFHYQGEHQRRSLKTSNLKVARQRAIELERQILDGMLEQPKSQGIEPPESICSAIGEFLDYLETEERRPKTIQKYRSILENFASFADLRGCGLPAEIDMRLFDQFRAFRKPLIGRKSMHHEGVLLKGFLEWCRQRKLVQENPLRDTKFKRPAPPRRGGPNLEQINAILGLSDQRRRPIVAFTGMRSGECRHLQPQDIEFRGNWIRIESREGYETKTSESRKVPIHPRLRQHLTGLAKRERPWFFTSPATPNYPNGDHFLNTKKLNEYFLELLKQLDIPAGRDSGFTLHSLRHSFKTICINAGIPREVVDAWQGHSPDRSAGSAYYRLSDKESQRFMLMVPFGTGEPTADVGDKES